MIPHFQHYQISTWIPFARNLPKHYCLSVIQKCCWKFVMHKCSLTEKTFVVPRLHQIHFSHSSSVNEMLTEYEVLDLVFSQVYQVKNKNHLYNLSNLTINNNITLAKNTFKTSCISQMFVHTTPPQQKTHSNSIHTSNWSTRHLLSKKSRFEQQIRFAAGC